VSCGRYIEALRAQMKEWQMLAEEIPLEKEIPAGR